MREKRERTEFAAIFKMAEDFTSDALLIFKSILSGKLRPVLDEGFQRVGGFAVNEADEADQLVPGLAMRVAVFGGVNGRELPFLFPGEGLDGLRQVGGECFQFVR